MGRTEETEAVLALLKEKAGIRITGTASGEEIGTDGTDGMGDKGENG